MCIKSHFVEQKDHPLSLMYVSTNCSSAWPVYTLPTSVLHTCMFIDTQEETRSVCSIAHVQASLVIDIILNSACLRLISTKFLGGHLLENALIIHWSTFISGKKVEANVIVDSLC